MRDYELLVALARNQGQFAVPTNHTRITGSVRIDAILQSHGENNVLFLRKIKYDIVVIIVFLTIYVWGEYKLNKSILRDLKNNKLQ